MSFTKGLAVLGSTGTIGLNTLALVRQFPEKFFVFSLAAGRNIERLKEQIREFRPRVVSVEASECLPELQAEFPTIQFGTRDAGLAACIEPGEVHTVVMGIVGFAALRPTWFAVNCRKRVALANKESLVVAGQLLAGEIKRTGAEVIPVDSEHNALFQLLQNVPLDQVDKLVLTASGGPLLRQPNLPLESVTPEVAVAHPNWKMGPKISVDSATMMNKGLELIEAHFLFGVAECDLEVWVHPQSIVHGAIWLKDNTCLSQLSKPDMRSSIGYALGYPERLENSIPRLTFSEMAKLEFFAPDEVRFPALKIAREALRHGSKHLVALNAANEVVVAAFLNRRVGFADMPQLIRAQLEEVVAGPLTSLEDIVAYDAEIRRQMQQTLDAIAR